MHRLSLAALLALALTSCATVMTGSTDRVLIESDPPGAAFKTNTGASGVTPMHVVVPEADELVVDYSLDGYEPTQAKLASRPSAWIAGNILIGGLIGLCVDFATGNYRTHDGTVSATLAQVTVP